MKKKKKRNHTISDKTIKTATQTKNGEALPSNLKFCGFSKGTIVFVSLLRE